MGQSLNTWLHAGISEAEKSSHKLDDFVINQKVYYCVKRNNRLLGDNFCHSLPLWPPQDLCVLFLTYIEHIHPLLKRENPQISSSC